MMRTNFWVIKKRKCILMISSKGSPVNLNNFPSTKKPIKAG